MMSSPSPCWSSQPSSYDMPEQPPPTTRMRSPHSGLPSSRRNSATFFAAVSVIVTIEASFEIKQILSQDTAGREQRQVFQRGAGGQRDHEHHGTRHRLGRE